jgi:hypothetical protein
MADEIIEELWRIKDELSKEAGDDMKAFCRTLNEKALARGVQLVDRSCPAHMLVAEDTTEYKIT